MKKIITAALMLSAPTMVFSQDDAPISVRGGAGQLSPLTQFPPLTQLAVVRPSSQGQEFKRWHAFMMKAWADNHPLVRHLMSTPEGNNFKLVPNYKYAKEIDAAFQRYIFEQEQMRLAQEQMRLAQEQMRLAQEQMRLAQEQIRDYEPDRSNLRKRASHIADELGCGLHQLSSLMEDDAQLIEELQAQVDKVRAHASQNVADGRVNQLYTYLTISAPSEFSKVEINHKFLSGIKEFNQSLDHLQHILGNMSDQGLKVAQKGILIGIKEQSMPEVSALNTMMQDMLPENITANDYEEIMSYLLTSSQVNRGLAFRPKGQNGKSGITALETLIGGFSFGVDHEMYPQRPNLFNFIIQCSFPADILSQLMAIRGSFCKFYAMITPDAQDILNDVPVINKIADSKSERFQLIKKLLAQSSPSINTLHYKNIYDNIILWRAHQIFEKLMQFNSARDFLNSTKLEEERYEELRVTSEGVLNIAKNFLDRDRQIFNLLKLVKELSGINHSFDRSVALQFEESLTFFLNTRAGELSKEILTSNFLRYFKDINEADKFFESLIRMNALKLKINAEKTTSEMIKRISVALQNHRNFVEILAEIASLKDKMPFKDFESDMGKQKTVYYLAELIRTYSTESYLAMSPVERKDRYRHTLAALQDSELWEKDAPQWCELFHRAHTAYIEARDSITAINLPQGNGQSKMLPGFDFTIDEDGSPSSVPSSAPFAPPPPPNFGFGYSWPAFNVAVKKYLHNNLASDDIILNLLQKILSDAQLYADYKVPDAQGLKAKLEENNIKI